MQSIGDIMKLKHHALAIASLAALGIVTTAHAAKVGADFEVYGNLYPQYQSSSYDGGTSTATSALPKASKSTALVDKTQVTPVNSYIGFKASRKFGEVRAGFDLQGNISIDENAKDAGFTTKPRDAFAFVQHEKLGTVSMGQMDTIYKKYGDRVRMLGVSSSNFVSTSTVASDVSWKSTANFNTRIGQQLAYETPRLNGFQAGFSEAKPWNAGAAVPSKKLSSVGANWTNGTYYVGLAQETHKAYLAAGNDKDTGNRLSLGYNAGKVRIGMDFSNLSYDNPSATVSNYKTTTWQVTGEYSLTEQWVVAANYAKGNKGSCTLVSNASCLTDGLGGNMVSLGARYNYDKDIGIFMLYGKKKANANASYNSSAATMFGGSLTDLAVGVQFKF
ncbi:hypothetical protein B9Z40_07165 [Limnohabitans sp. 15K]|nr:hypothetical protein B9Z40_07165 [Limnohabitans sp. 15K]